MDMELNEDSSTSVWKYIESKSFGHSKQIVQEDAVTGEKITFEQLSENVNRFSSALETLTIPGGVAICSENNIQFCWILLGALHAGARCSFLVPAYAAGELRHFLRVTRPSIVLCSKLVSEKVYEDGDSFHDICSEHAFIESIYAWGIEKDCGKYTPLSSLLGASPDPEESNDLVEEVRGTADREALVLPSSGTTGLPKGVVHTHRSIIAALKMCDFVVSENSIGLGLMPMFHAYGLIVSLLHLCQRSKLVVVPKFLGAKNLRDLIVRHRMADLYLVPSLLATIGKDPIFDQDVLSSVRHVWTAAGMVSSQMLSRAQKKLPNVSLHNSFGMTETIFITLSGECEKSESLGKLIAGMECRILNGDQVCQANEIGELQFKGPMLMKGYLNDKEATTEALIDGWLKTGDLGYYDDNHDFFVVGRMKEMIKYQGYQVSPVEIEKVISMIPDVEESLVVGLPDEDFGFLPAAGIVLKEGSTLSKEAVEQYVARRLSPHKRLRGGVFFVQQLPRTAAGKVSRAGMLRLINVLLAQRQAISTTGRRPGKLT